MQQIDLFGRTHTAPAPTPVSAHILNVTERDVETFVAHCKVGRQNATRSEELVLKMGLVTGGRGAKDCRKLRAIAQAANFMGYPVASDSVGYYIPATMEEGLSVIKLHERKASTLRKRLRAYKTALVAHFNHPKAVAA